MPNCTQILILTNFHEKKKQKKQEKGGALFIIPCFIGCFFHMRPSGQSHNIKSICTLHNCVHMYWMYTQ